jgi:RES domain-containing protein
LKDYHGIVWRHIPAGGQALHLGYVLKAAGRWNRAGIYGCLYTSLSKEACLAEYAKYLRRAGIPPGSTKPRELVSILVEVSPIYDLTDPVASLISPSSSFLTGDSEDDLEQCRSLADYIRSQGYAGIVTPSSALPSEKNLIIYFDGLASAIPTLLEGPDRFTITPDPRI